MGLIPGRLLLPVSHTASDEGAVSVPRGHLCGAQVIQTHRDVIKNYTIGDLKLRLNSSVGILFPFFLFQYILKTRKAQFQFRTALLIFFNVRSVQSLKNP